MTMVVFAGPTIGAAEIRARLDAVVLPPAALGDVLRAVRGAPRVIALIDGVFERVLPVWHKEILWALARGVHVFGAASMGALRAAELHQFGMVGVGRIFEGYRDGELEADDEVAVLHGPAEVGYAPVTEALVNMRATLERAQVENILDAKQSAAVAAVARALHYHERTWELVLERVGSAAPVHELRSWLPGGRVDQKRADASLLLDRVAEFIAQDPPPMQAKFAFAWTDAWEALYCWAATGETGEAVLDELRLQADRFPTVRQLAVLRLLARRELERTGLTLEPALLRETYEQFRARLSLWQRSDLERWLAASDLDATAFGALIEEEASIKWLAAQSVGVLGSAMLAELRATGAYASLAERAREKAQRLAAAGLDSVSIAQAGVDLAPLLARLSELSGGDPSGSTADLARRLGFADRTSLERAALRELLFLGIMHSKGDAT
jgi:hypothetical protein